MAHFQYTPQPTQNAHLRAWEEWIQQPGGSHPRGGGFSSGPADIVLQLLPKMKYGSNTEQMDTTQRPSYMKTACHPSTHMPTMTSQCKQRPAQNASCRVPTQGHLILIRKGGRGFRRVSVMQVRGPLCIVREEWNKLIRPYPEQQSSCHAVCDSV